jgi:integrase
MQVHRGVVETTLIAYGNYVEDLVRVLGDDPQAYTPHGLRDFVAQRCRHYRRTSSRMVLAAVRMFLRYLAIEGHCRPGLEHALMPLANWSQSSLPRGLSGDEIGRVLAACPSTPRGLRDRAILLLMIRLGLRAGDVAKLRFSALCFETATIRVSGKREEVFGPVVTVDRYRDFADAVAAVNDSPYGLQAGVFTRDLRHAFAAFAGLEVGAVVVNDYPTLRVDNYPYGGVKDSGLGREGVRYAMEEMTEVKTLVVNPRPVR